MPDISATAFRMEDIQFDDVGFLPERNRFYLYVVANIGTEFLKIGVSSNPRKRVLTMQTGNPLPLKIAHVRGFNSSEIAFQVEARMHFILGAFNKHGEWFSTSISNSIECLDKAYTQVRNKRGELQHKPSQRRSVHLNWDYSE